MGRETKLLLGLLALLAGVFMGLLSMKLLVPRPPAGTGPDIHADLAEASEPHDLVEPPRFDRPVPAAAAPPPSTGDDRFSVQRSRFAAPPNDAPSDSPAAFAAVPPSRDPFVTTASHERPAPPDDLLPPIASAARPVETGPLAAPATPAVVPAAPPTPAIAATSHVARPGDSWWSLAERAYGDGRLYRALFAWNRTLDPRVSLVPGTSIEIPAPERLQAAWPTLVPDR